MADENIKWASLGGLKTSTPARLRDFGYTTSNGTSSGTPEYPILEYDNFWRSSISSIANSNLDRLDNLSASDVYYTFLIEDGSNVVVNDPFDTFHTTYGTASSSAGTTSLASQTSGTDYTIDFDGPSSQYAVSGDQARPIKDGNNLYYQGVQPVAGSDTQSLYAYGMNDVGGLSYSGASAGLWGIPIHKYDPIVGTYVLDHRVGCVDLLPSFTMASQNDSNGSALFGTIQHGDILYCLFWVPSSNGTTEVSYNLVKYDMANRVNLHTRTLIYSPTSGVGTLTVATNYMNALNRNCHMAISPSGNKMSVIAPNAFLNSFKIGGFNTHELVTAGFIVDLTSPTLDYSNTLSTAKDWSASTYLQSEYNNAYYDICRWADDDNLHMVSAFPKITNRSVVTGVGYIQHQLIDVTGVAAANNTTTNLTTDILSSSSNITQGNFQLESFCADINVDLGEFVVRAANYNASQSPITDPYILNRFDLSSLSILATNESWTPNLINGAGVPLYTTATRGMVYDYNGHILNPIVSRLGFAQSATTPYVAYIPSQFTSGSAGTVITNEDFVNMTNLGQVQNPLMCNILSYTTHTRFLLGGSSGYYDTETRRAGGNYLNASSNAQSFDPITIVGRLDNLPLSDPFLPYIKRLEFVPSNLVENTDSIALWFDTSSSAPSSLTVELNVGSQLMSVQALSSGSWDTLLDNLVLEMTKQGNTISNATRLGEDIIYATLSYIKNNGSVQTVTNNVTIVGSGLDFSLGSIVSSSMDSSIIENTDSKVLYGVDYTSMSAALSTSYTDITFKQYDTYVTSITNVQQALDSLFKIVQDLEDFEPASALAINVANATRFTSLNLALTANTPVNLNHALGEKYVVATVYSDSTDESQQATIVLVDEDNCTVEVGVTGTYNVVIVK